MKRQETAQLLACCGVKLNNQCQPVSKLRKRAVIHTLTPFYVFSKHRKNVTLPEVGSIQVCLQQAQGKRHFAGSWKHPGLSSASTEKTSLCRKLEASRSVFGKHWDVNMPEDRSTLDCLQYA
jgi:hypothetical protein